MMIETYDAGEVFTMVTDFYWYGYPRQDFTLSIYSVDGNDITDEDGNTNMLHTDGQTPSEFEYVKTAINPDLPFAWKTDPETTAVTSVLDMWAKSDTFSHFLAYLNNNKWAFVDPFGVLFG